MAVVRPEPHTALPRESAMAFTHLAVTPGGAAKRRRPGAKSAPTEQGFVYEPDRPAPGLRCVSPGGRNFTRNFN